MDTQEQTTQLNTEDAALAVAAREALEAKATMLGVKFHPSLSNEKLAERIKEHVEKEAMPKTTEKVVEQEETEVVTTKSGKETDIERRLRLKREASELVRVVITCMNPRKKEHGGQFFSVGNAVVGTFTKYVPFENEEGWHVPRIILQAIKDAEYQSFYKDSKNPNITLSKRVKEFAIRELPKLTKEELHDLAQRQAMSKSID